MLAAAKSARQFRRNLASQGIFVKKLEGEMLSRTLPAILLQICCEVVLNTEDIVRIIEDPDDNLQKNSLVFMG